MSQAVHSIVILKGLITSKHFQPLPCHKNCYQFSIIICLSTFTPLSAPP